MAPDNVPARVVVIGGGSWGTAVAKLLAERLPVLSLWVYERELVGFIRETGENPLYLPGIRLPRNVEAFSEPSALQPVDLVVWAVPSHALRQVVERFLPYLSGKEISVTLTKGIEESSLLTASQLLGTLLPGEDKGRIVVLSGPSFAVEVSRGLPCAVVVAGKNRSVASEVQDLFAAQWFRVYQHDDPLGVEIGGALKNVMAIAVGISDGMELGDNARAALITRGLAEIIRLGVAMGADSRTFSGLAGIGDLVLTCTGALSRNRSVGMRIGRGETLEEITGGMRMVAEGVRTVKAVTRLAERWDVDMPITSQVYRVLYEGADPRKSVEDLMTRPPTSEWR